jgi:hypothetical protein
MFKNDVILESPRSVPETPLELIHNPFQFSDSDILQDESQPATIEMEEEKEKIIQKEVIHTGSVSCYFFFTIIFRIL